MKQILVATDFGEAAAAALDYGLDLARMYGARLHVVHVVKDLAASAPIEAPVTAYHRLQEDQEAKAQIELDELVDRVDEGRQVSRTLLRARSPAAAILDYASRESIDLIVLGTHGRSGFSEFFMGSVAQKVVRSAVCPVLTVRDIASAVSRAGQSPA